jgi:hypothetical protein
MSMLKKLLLLIFAFAIFASAESKPVVVVELFTSEGCSSCPPADALFRDLQVRGFPGAELVLLGEHVDYWNQLGWRDAYSSEQFTARQQEYANKLKLRDYYTPQAVVDGKVEFVGSDEGALHHAILKSTQTPKPLSVTLSWDEGTQTAHVSAAGSGTGELYLALTEVGLSSQVTAGENAGNRLTHAAVVRRLKDTGGVSGAFSKEIQFPLERGWTASHLRLAAFVQDKATGAILGAVSVPLKP